MLLLYINVIIYDIYGIGWYSSSIHKHAIILIHLWSVIFITIELDRLASGLFFSDVLEVLLCEFPVDSLNKIMAISDQKYSDWKSASLSKHGLSHFGVITVFCYSNCTL